MEKFLNSAGLQRVLTGLWEKLQQKLDNLPSGGGNLYRKALEEGTDYTLTVNIPNPGEVTDIEVFIEFQEEIGGLDEIQLQLVAIIPESIAGGPNIGPLIEVLAKKECPHLKNTVFICTAMERGFLTTRFLATPLSPPSNPGAATRCVSFSSLATSARRMKI